MKNLISIEISNNTGIADSGLYVFITDGNDNFYHINAVNRWVAEAQTAACSILLSAIPSTNEVYKFYLDSSNGMVGGRIWFSTSSTALSQGSKGIVQPTALADFVFDFIEIALTPTAGSTLGNANIDTSQVDGLGIPITLYVNPVANGATFPPPSTVDISSLNYPNVIGIKPWLSLRTIISNFTSNLPASYSPFSVCGWSSGQVNRLVAPFHLINMYSSGTPPTSLATFLDHAIYKFFEYYMTNTLTLQDPVSLIQYNGTVTTITEGAANYNVLQFTSTPATETYNVYFPYFTTNCSGFPDTLDPNVTLEAPPSWWTGNLPTTMPATAMVLACAGTFSDSKYQPNIQNSTLLGNLENQVVSILTRGLSPVINNFISFSTQFSAAQIQYNQVSITDLPKNTLFSTNMSIVKQISAQPTTIVSSNVAGNDTVQIIITDPVGQLLPVPECLFLCGNFYPDTETSAGFSNIYSNYLHNGLSGCVAPLLNNIGYGYAFDDQGGYSNDVTATYDSNNSLRLGVFLGPL